MAVESTNISVVYTVTSASAGQEFPITFPYINASHVVAYYSKDGEKTNLTYGTDYTVSGTTLTVTGTLSVGVKLVISRSTPLTQEIDWEDGQAVYTPDIEQADDKLTFIAQEFANQIDRAVKITNEDAAAGVTPEDLRDDFFEARDAAAASASAAAISESNAATSEENAASSASDAAQSAANAQAIADTGIIAAGTTTARLLSDRFADVINVRDYGAKGDGVTDDTAAFKAAFASNYEAIFIPCGIYICKEKLEVENKNFALIGEGRDSSEIRFDTTVDIGISVHNTSEYRFLISNIYLSTNILNTGTALKISYVGYEGLYNRSVRHATIENCRISGIDRFSNAWKNGIVFDECSHIIVKEVEIIGYRDLDASGELQFWPFCKDAILYTSTTDMSPTDCFYQNVYINNYETGIRTQGVLEGVEVIACNIVACKNGIIDDRRDVVGEDTIDPVLKVVNTHLNTGSIGISSKYCYEGHIESCILYQFIYVDIDYTGILLDHGNIWNILNNLVLCNASSTSSKIGISLKQNHNSFVFMNTIQCSNAPVQLTQIINTRIINNRAIDSNGKEQKILSITDSSSPYTNTVSNYAGIIAEGHNTESITATADTATTLSLIPLNDFPDGSVFRITAVAQVTKGGSTGESSSKVYIGKVSGDASITHLDGGPATGTQIIQKYNTVWLASFSSIIKKVGNGSLQLVFGALSKDVNASIPANNSSYIVERIV